MTTKKLNLPMPKACWAVSAFAVAFLLVLAPQLALMVHTAGHIYTQVQDVPAVEYAIVFGAYVFEDQTLSDAALERIEAAVQVYRQGRVRKLFISGDNRSNRQADAMAAYAQAHGVAAGDIVVDRLGIDTHDTCRHFAMLAAAGLAITQEFHLPRAMYMCERDGVEVAGLAVNRLGLLATRGDSVIGIYTTRLSRLMRESLLTWSFVLGIYDKVSVEAEALE